MFWSTIGDVRKCTDEEHITYSGGSKIKDLAQCGWGEKKMKYNKRKKGNKMIIWEIVKYEKMKILVFNRLL